MNKELVLVLGGARSGKSAFAQGLARSSGGKVLFIATAQAGDAEMTERIQRHRAARPPEWDTLEEPLHLARAIEGITQHDVALVDCLGLWVSNLLLQADERQAEAATEAAILETTRALLQAYDRGRATLILVSNEVGMGLVPPYPMGRHFRDTLGRANQMVASRADKVYLLVAGLAVELKSLGAAQAMGEGGPSEK